MSITIGDVAWAIGGDLTGFDKALTQAEKSAGKTGDSIGKRLKEALSPKAVLGDIFKGMELGAGIAGFNGLLGSIESVVHAIPNLIERGKQYAQTVHDIQEVTNGTAHDTSVFVGTLEALGIPTEGVAIKLGTLAIQVQGDGAIWKKYGIAIEDANHVQLDMITILDNARQALGKLTSASERDAVARQLLGRAGLDFIDFLKLSNAQAALLAGQLDALGLVLSQNLIDAAKKSEIEANQLNLAFTGLGVALFSTFGPIIRTVMGEFVKWMVDTGKTIRETIAGVAAAIAGLIQGLTGWDTSGLSTLSEKIMNLADPGSGRLGQLRTSLRDANDQLKAQKDALAEATKATSADTTAINANIARTERKIAVLEKAEAAEQTAYERTMARTGQLVQGQIDLLDAKEKALAQARSERDLAVQLAVAEEDLRKARDTTGDKTIDVAAENAARLKIADIQAQIAEAARAKDVAAQRQSLIDTKTYLADLAALEKDATNRKALANTLAKRQSSLESQIAAAQAKGDTQGVANLTVELEAVKTTQTRNQAAIRAATQKTELEKTRGELEALKKSIQDAFGAMNPAADKARADIVLTEGKINDLNQDIQSLYVQGATLMGSGRPAAEPPLGAGGGLAKALDPVVEEWTKKGKALRGTIQDILDVLGAIPTAIDTIIAKFTDWAKWEPPQWLKDLGAIVDQLLLHTPTTEFFNKTTNPDLNPWAPKPPKTPIPSPPGGFGHNGQPVIDALRKLDPKELIDLGLLGQWGGILSAGMTNAQAIAALIAAGYGRSAGGGIPVGGAAFAGEGGHPEIVAALPGGGAWILPLSRAVAGASVPPSLAAAAAAGGLPGMGGDRAVHVLHAYFDRHEIAVLLDEENAWLPQ